MNGACKVKAEILDENAVARAITRISFEIIERNKGTDDLCLVGLFSRGAVLADDASRIDFDITDKRVVIIDDVIYTGRTARAAIDGLLSRGRPTLIQLAALIDRGHRELPIRADYIGKNLPTSREEKVKVMVRELDGCDKVVIVG